jgi:hypothetical protein
MITLTCFFRYYLSNREKKQLIASISDFPQWYVRFRKAPAHYALLNLISSVNNQEHKLAFTLILRRISDVVVLQDNKSNGFRVCIIVQGKTQQTFFFSPKGSFQQQIHF